MTMVGMDNPMSQTLTFTLLRLLADGKFHSGEVLAQRLGISRTSVHNALRGVGDFGLALYSIRGRGYCLSNPPQWLDAASIVRHLGEQGRSFNIEILDSTPSSNTLLLQRAAQGAPSGTALAVEWQSAGRGRLGRSWHAGLGNALTFSLLWRFEFGLSALSGLSLAAGVALMRALHSFGITSAQLKWPNDVLGENGKLAGILIEAHGDMLGPCAVVIGIGLNLSAPHHLLSQIEQPVSSVQDLAATMPERNALLARILNELQKMLHEFSSHGFATVRAEWERYHAWQNQTVRLVLPDGSSAMGIAHGVTESGALVVETAQGRKIFNNGEVSLRPA